MDDVLMRSPEPPSLLAWTLRPRPTGRRRLALSYLVAGAGAAVAALIVIVTAVLTDSCQAGFGCLGFFFRGVGLAVVLGLVVLLGGSLITKLGWLYFLGLIAFALPVVSAGVALVMLGVPAMPFALAALVGVPAVASWFSHPGSEEDGSAAADARLDARLNARLIGRSALLAAPAALSVCAVVAVV